MQKKILVQALTLAGLASFASFTMAADEDKSVQKIEITGSHIKRANTEAPGLVQTLSKKDIEATGAVTVADLMSKLPALGSSNQVDSRDGGFSKGLATASLRGLGSASTLVLLNGRRMAPSAYADPNQGQSTQYDLNSIPISALERVEVLKDGASAVYGSDAIAGVINFITKKDYKGGEIALRASMNGDNEFRRQGISGAYGFGDLENDKYNVFLAFDAGQRQRTALADANAVQVDQYKALTGRLTQFGSGVSKYPVFFKESKLGSGNYNTYVGADLSCGNPLTGSVGLVPMRSSDVLLNKKFCNYDAWAYEDAQGKGKTANFLTRGEYKLGAETYAYGEYAYSRSELEYTGVSRTLSRTLTTVFPKAGAGISFLPVLSVNHPDNPTRGTANPVPVTVNYRFENARGGSENTNTTDRLLLGVRGVNFGWDWDSGLLYNRSKRHQLSYGFVSLPIVRDMLAANQPLSAIAATPGVTRDVFLDGESTLTQWDLKGSTEIGKLRGGAVGLAVGVEYKQEKMNIVPDPLTVNGQIIGLANQYSNAKRNVAGAFMELRAPITKAFEVEFATRYDKYDGFKSSFTPKIGAKYAVNDTLSLRSTFSTGFRAPSLTQIVDGGTQYFLNGFEDKLRCGKPGADSTDCSKSLSGVAAANPKLDPETSKSFTAGLVFSPTRNLDILVDYFRIRKEKEVDLLSPQGVIDNPAYANYVVRDQNKGTWLTDANGNLIPNSGPLISIGTPYINAGGTDTSGVDLEVNLRNSLGDKGKLATRLNATYTMHYKKAQNANDVMYDLVGTNGAIANDVTSVGEVPRLKASLSSTWTYQAHNLTATVNYVSPISMVARYSTQDDGNVGPYATPYCQYGRANFQPNYTKFYPACEVPSWTTIDVAYSYTGFKNLTLGLNIQNLFNSSAPYDPSYGTAGYNTGIHNPYGRYFTVKANYKF